tara:strand:- start:303 stop:431 length:129 start_codon:yes stop_codon:yes gene_type:complete
MGKVLGIVYQAISTHLIHAVRVPAKGRRYRRGPALTTDERAT